MRLRAQKGPIKRHFPATRKSRFLGASQAIFSALERSANEREVRAVTRSEPALREEIAASRRDEDLTFRRPQPFGDGARAFGIELARHVVEQQHGVGSARSADAFELGKLQRERDE